MNKPSMLSFPCILNAWNAHEGELRNYIRHRAGDAHLADDLLQEVFVKAMQQGRQFCTLDNERAWLFQVARNALIDQHRRGRNVIELEDDIPNPEPAPEPLRVLSTCVARVLSELSPEDRDIIEQCDLEGVKQKTYATAQGLSLAAAKSRLLRARSRMRDRMSTACQVQFDESGRVESHIPRN
ncbi:sigma-70 family RNA polymerase sigma factor [Sideroxydans lithotrophicus]|nr:sigma-70 family RNA polymerase sigma factor [Sideroxydans lithotrophicus]